MADATGYTASGGTGASIAGTATSGTGSNAITGTGASLAGAIGSGESNLAIGSGASECGADGSGSADGGGSIAGASGSGTGTGSPVSDAAGIWLYLHTIPPAQVYDVDALRGRMNPLHPMMRVPFSVSDTAAQLGQQNDNFRVSLDRPSATLRRLLSAQAPYGVRVDVMDGGTLSRTGIVSSVDGGSDGFDLDCESAGWTDDLPLRTNADLGIFRDVVPLPWRYGRNVAGKCVRLGSPETSYLASPTEVVRQAGYGWQVVRLDARGVNNTECPGEPEYVFGVGRQRGTTLAASATAIASSEKTIAYTDDGAGTQRLGLQLGAFQNQCLAHGTHMYFHGSNCYDGHDGGNAPGTAFLESLASVWGYMGRVVEFKHGAESAV